MSETAPASDAPAMEAPAIEARALRKCYGDFEAVRARVSPRSSPVPIIAIPAPDLRAYDHLLVGGAA